MKRTCTALRLAGRAAAWLSLTTLPSILGGPAAAYTAAGDRLFPATILLPQLSPTDELYVTGESEPVPGRRLSSVTMNFNKTITERLGFGIGEGYSWTGQAGPESGAGWQNTTFVLQYVPVVDAADELILSLGAERELGGTGTARAGANAVGASTGMIFLGKGFGDVDTPALRPFALEGMLGYSLGDSSARPDQWVGGVVLEYSMPYFASKVASGALPDIVRSITPMVELLIYSPAQSRSGSATTGMLAPGLAYAGSGWELSAEALVPVLGKTDNGAGFTVQLHFALDYLLPETLGRPLIE